MAKNEINLTVGSKSSGTADIIHTVPTYKRIVEDALFFLDQSKKNTSEIEKNRYARVTTLLMSFYIESISNVLYDDFLGKSDLREVENRDKLSMPKGSKLRMSRYTKIFRAVYFKLYKKELSIDIKGIRDIFAIRNKIIAHPAGFSKEKDSETGWKRVDQNVIYEKFKNFPFTYSKFNITHAEAVIEEVKNFLISFHKLLKDKGSKQKLLDACWPTELIKWYKNK